MAGSCIAATIGNRGTTLSCFSNSAAIIDTLQVMTANFSTLYRKKAMVHHYIKYCHDSSIFDESLEMIQSFIDNLQQGRK
eukprot:9628469-Ditylum_brightwellii.AAC.1